MMKEFHVRAAMIDRVALVTHNTDSPLIESECRMSEISGQNLDTTLVPARRKLSLIERLPQTGLGRLPVRGADVAGDVCVGLLEQRGEKMTADEAGGSGQENAFGLVRGARAPVSLMCDGRKMSRDRSGAPSEGPSMSSIAARSLTTGVV